MPKSYNFIVRCKPSPSLNQDQSQGYRASILTNNRPSKHKIDGLSHRDVEAEVAMVISFMNLNSHCRLPCLNWWIMERIRNGLEYNGLWRRMPRKRVSSTLSYQLTCCIASYYDVTRMPSILSISGLCCTALWHGTAGVLDQQWQAHCCLSHN